ncbi:MAG: 4-hydroxy-tetrahydrodipicolinate synthase [Planctomycetota bacterium]
MWSGSWVALATPFREGEVDFDTLDRLVELQIEGGTQGLVACGTTAETPTLSAEEYRDVVERILRAADGRVPVLVGTGSNDTRRSVAMTRLAAELGANGALVVVPYYNKPNQEGLFWHYRTIAEEGGLPVMLYNVPGRTGCELAIDTVARLSEVEGIVAIKEASPDIDRTSRIRSACDLAIFSGNDSMTLPILSLGGQGVVSVAANVIPELVAELCRTALAGDFAAARDIHLRLFPLFEALFVEPNPIPLKAALEQRGLGTDEVRLPLAPANEQTRGRIAASLQKLASPVSH